MPLFRTSLLVLILTALMLSGCSSSSQPDSSSGHVISVDNTSIQAALDKAQPGDLILLEAGTYTGDVTIDTSDITLRGRDRSSVIIDGKFEQENGITVQSDGVRIENMTVQSFTSNAIAIANDSKKIDRYAVAYVTVAHNGGDGISARNAANGIVDSVYAVGNAHAGINISDCGDCTTLVANTASTLNGIGIAVSETEENVVIAKNDFQGNRTGIYLVGTEKPSSPELDPSIIIGNNVSNNSSSDAPSTTPDLYGVGIRIEGASNFEITHNRADNNVQMGMVLVNHDEIIPQGNTFKENNARSNGSPAGFDFAYIVDGKSTVTPNGNCFIGNSYSSSSIDHIEKALSCNAPTNPEVPSQHFPIFTIPKAKDYTSVVVDISGRENMEGDVKKIPAKLANVTFPDLSEVGLPS